MVAVRKVQRHGGGSFPPACMSAPARRMAAPSGRIDVASCEKNIDVAAFLALVWRVSVRKSASELKLSSLTLGRLREGVIPSYRTVASVVAPSVGPPLSQCTVRFSAAPRCSAQASSNSRAACSELSSPRTTALMMRRLHTSKNR